MSGKALQTVEKRSEAEGKGEKERDIHLNAVPENNKER